MAIEKFIVPASASHNELVIFAEKANINYFLKTPLVSATVAGPVDKQAAVKASVVRQYPGDPTTFNRPATQKEFVVDPTRKSGNALPGKSFRLTMDMGQVNEETRQFTFKGRMMDLNAWLRGAAKAQLHLFGPSGTRYTIPAPTAP